MATLSDAQIAQILAESNGNTKILTDAGIGTGQIVRALVANPNVVAQLQKGAAKAVTGYGRFYKNKVYDPAWAMNGVETKWSLASKNQARFALDFWKKVKEQGIDKTTFNAVLSNIEDNKETYLSQYNVSEDEFSDMISTFEADYDDFRESEKNRLRKQYKAYKDTQNDMGITPDDNNIPGLAGYNPNGPDYRKQTRNEYLAAKTGIVGLESIPQNVDEYAANTITGFKSFAKKKGLDVTRIDALTPQLIEVVKKKVGKNYQNYALQDLLKRQVTGQ